MTEKTDADSEHITPMVFPESGEHQHPATPREQQVRYKAFHDAYRCAARVAKARGHNDLAWLLFEQAADVKKTALVKAAAFARAEEPAC